MANSLVIHAVLITMLASLGIVAALFLRNAERLMDLCGRRSRRNEWTLRLTAVGAPLWILVGPGMLPAFFDGAFVMGGDWISALTSWLWLTFVIVVGSLGAGLVLRTLVRRSEPLKAGLWAAAAAAPVLAIPILMLEFSLFSPIYRPLFIVTLAALAAALWHMTFWRLLLQRWTVRIKSHARTPHCAACGYDLTGLRSPICPECGDPVDPRPGPGRGAFGRQAREKP